MYLIEKISNVTQKSIHIRFNNSLNMLNITAKQMYIYTIIV